MLEIHSTDPAVTPIVKWVGGKRQLLDAIVPLIPKHSTYYEPFVGGGAVLFSYQPERAVINDSNEELMNIYKVVKNNPQELVEVLQKHAAKNSEEYYYEIRNLDRSFETYMDMSDVDRAARILYLNKTCFNGLYRVNKAGEFNVPWGRYKNPQIVNERTIHAVSKYLNDAKVRILCEDYRDTFRGIDKDAFVYMDPPYMPLNQTSNFTSYTAAGFGEAQHRELKKQCDLLTKRGVKFLLSNSCCELTEEIFKDYIVEKVYAKRSINSKGDKRGDVAELLIRNYEL